MAVNTDRKRKIKKTFVRKVQRNKKGQFTKGNPGKPKGAKSVFTIEILQEAVRTVEKEKRKSLFEHFVRQAFKDKQVLVALMKKFIPDRKQTEIEPGEGLQDFMRIYLPKKDGMVSTAKTRVIP
jgi:hypothetical protein